MYEKCSIFVGNLAIFCTEKDIEEAFSPFGQILSISIKCDEETSKNLSYGFIKFASEISAHQAMKSLNGSILCGRPLR
jgi:RNA recognition motif-containing protein